jgi:hypothetical protein
MKKITFLAILMATFITNAQIILSEDFETSYIYPVCMNENTYSFLEALAR